jgi:hypothetical protein
MAESAVVAWLHAKPLKMRLPHASCAPSADRNRVTKKSSTVTQA